ncbi:MAG: hypothetical protein CFE23_03570 [Flavobacterium sp. BFFFF1]|uniref:T9SS type A sorting domain-containing protein n=1 Tax=Flavobacterium sp. BFFFF1 TaxID=2015557 RepID=UPI000BCFAB77|nr:T9SS type A sorting domain-containing protein [Flavobacterium sp. BFFFF1]OYU81558.1 MAG: hypothetical protein CFE23_03570 [Flavobacterium sp. BFFFF1]
MKKIFTIIAVFAYSAGLYSQETTLCENPGFENATNHFQYYSASLFSNPVRNDHQSCATPTGTSNYTTYTPSATVNRSSDTSLANGNDPFINPSPYVTPVARVHSGNYAVRLESNFISGTSSNGMVTLSGPVNIGASQDVFGFAFSLIFQYSNKDSHTLYDEEAYFRARLVSGGTVVSEICIKADPTKCYLNKIFDPAPNLIDNTVTMYTGWVCGRLNSSTIHNQQATLEFLVEGCSTYNQHRTIVYIDDVCSTCSDTDLYTNCCKPDFTATNFVTPYYEEDKSRSQWINCINTIWSGAKAIYHAGDYVEMNPGFEALSGSQFAAYIESCSNSYVYRPSQDMEEPLPAQSNGIRIYPNPSHSLITLSYEAADLKSITITGMDGKRILARPASGREMQIDVSGFSNGIYLVTVETSERKILNSKFVKN